MSALWWVNIACRCASLNFSVRLMLLCRCAAVGVLGEVPGTDRGNLLADQSTKRCAELLLSGYDIAERKIVKIWLCFGVAGLPSTPEDGNNLRSVARQPRSYRAGPMRPHFCRAILQSFCRGDRPRLAGPSATVVIAGRPRWCGHHVRDATKVWRCVCWSVFVRRATMLRIPRWHIRPGDSSRGGREAFLAVDRMGVASLAYCPTRGGIAFGSSADLVNACLDARRKSICRASTTTSFFTWCLGRRRFSAARCESLRAASSI